MTSRLVRGAVLSMAVLVAGGLAGCTPPVPITVTTTASGADHAPGDGVCEITPGAGDCSLQAAVDEANTLPKVSITVPPGDYAGMDLVVTSKVLINWGSPKAVVLGDVSIDVAAGGHLQAEGLMTGGAESADVQLTVAGVLQLRRSTIANVSPDLLHAVALTVSPGGTAAVEDSILFGGAHAVENGGGVVVVRSALFNVASGVIGTSGDGVTRWQATLLSRAVNTGILTVGCFGTGDAASAGYSFYARSGSGCTMAATDQSQLEVVAWGGGPPGVPYALPAAAVDAIPVGEAGCSPTAVDLYGNPRGVDGNGDGIPGCDIGAYERQP